MSDEAGFLAAIAAAPGDDTNRLVYADWLEERALPGDAEKMKFIRAVAALRAISLDNPEIINLGVDRYIAYQRLSGKYPSKHIIHAMLNHQSTVPEYPGSRDHVMNWIRTVFPLHNTRKVYEDDDRRCIYAHYNQHSLPLTHPGIQVKTTRGVTIDYGGDYVEGWPAYTRLFGAACAMPDLIPAKAFANNTYASDDKACQETLQNISCCAIIREGMEGLQDLDKIIYIPEKIPSTAALLYLEATPFCGNLEDFFNSLSSYTPELRGLIVSNCGLQNSALNKLANCKLPLEYLELGNELDNRSIQRQSIRYSNKFNAEALIDFAGKAKFKELRLLRLPLAPRESPGLASAAPGANRSCLSESVVLAFADAITNLPKLEIIQSGNDFIEIKALRAAIAGENLPVFQQFLEEYFSAETNRDEVKKKWQERIEIGKNEGPDIPPRS